ncbi:hypothetical protein ACSMXN_23330 [Jatrophihabitans sp. DSM 45814]
MNGQPAINQLISLRADNGQEYASRVEDVGDGCLTVARPLDLPAEHGLWVGCTVETTWHVSSGLCVLPCKLVGVRREGAVPLWDIDIVGNGWREQRRAFVRAAVMGTVALRWASADGTGHEATGVVADLSEAGVRCTSKSQSLVDHPPTDSPVELLLKTSGNSFELHADVLRVTEVSPTDGHPTAPPQWQIVLLFADQGKIADDLRRIVFNQQLLERNGRRATQ